MEDKGSRNIERTLLKKLQQLSKNIWIMSDLVAKAKKCKPDEILQLHYLQEAAPSDPTPVSHQMSQVSQR